MELSGANQTPSQQPNFVPPNAGEHGAEFMKKLDKALTRQHVAASENLHKQKFKEDKSNVEDGENMAEETELELLTEVEKLKRRLGHIVEKREEETEKDQEDGNENDDAD